MPHAFLEDIATADIAFKAWGDTVEELFVSAADALLNAMSAAPDSVRGIERREIAVESDSLEMLLFEFLQELIFLKDAEGLLLRVDSVEMGGAPGARSLRASARGETADGERHQLVVDVKAVTLYGYRVERTAGGWEAEVVLDV